ncbi:MAG: 3-oxoacyl-ACP synthase III family protein [Thermodesulfobacteriota bacterium]
MNRRAYIRSSGMYVPDTVVTNDDLAKLMTTSDEWIQRRSGIRERRYAAPGDRCSDLAKRSVENLLAKGAVQAEEIDAIIYATLSPDFHFPGSGVLLQEKMGWADRQIPCYDIRQQCSGFIYGLQMAQAFVEAGMYRNVLLVGAELHSNALEYNDRGRAVTVLFGDGAASVLVSPSTDDNSVILTTEVHSDGRGALDGVHLILFDIGKKPIVYYDPKNENENVVLFPEMPNPKNLFTNAVRRMVEVSLSCLNRLGMTVADVDWVLPHQANKRINAMAAEYLSIPEEKVLYNIHKYGNTTAATIPLLLDEFTGNGTIKRGDTLLLVGFGSGFTWGAGIVKY